MVRIGVSLCALMYHDVLLCVACACGLRVIYQATVMLCLDYCAQQR